jgi:hypothetical protein
MIAGVVVLMDGVIGELAFTAVVFFLFMGIVQPATTTQPMIIKRVRGMIIFAGIRDVFPGV